MKHMQTCFLIPLLLASAALAQTSRPTTSTAPAGLTAYKPGIRINWRDRQVEADTTVVLREGLIELFAASPKTREYEAIVRMNARPLHLFEALGLIGLTPGHPIRLKPGTEEVEPAVGDPVAIEIRYRSGDKTIQEPIENWLRLARTKQPVEPIPWVFAGSTRSERGAFAADGEGTVIALVDFPSALIAPPERHSDSNDELWLEPATDHVPPLETSCTLVFAPGPMPINVDAAGRVRANGKVLLLGDLARIVEKRAREDKVQRVLINVAPQCPETELNRIIDLLHSVGLKKDDIEVRRRPAENGRERQPTTASAPADEPQAMRTWLQQMRAELSGSGRSTLAQSSHELAADLQNRSLAMRARTEATVAYVAVLTRDLQQLLSQPVTSTAPAH